MFNTIASNSYSQHHMLPTTMQPKNTKCQHAPRCYLRAWLTDCRGQDCFQWWCSVALPGKSALLLSACQVWPLDQRLVDLKECLKQNYSERQPAPCLEASSIPCLDYAISWGWELHQFAEPDCTNDAQDAEGIMCGAGHSQMQYRFQSAVLQHYPSKESLRDPYLIK